MFQTARFLKRNARLLKMRLDKGGKVAQSLLQNFSKCHKNFLKEEILCKEMSKKPWEVKGEERCGF